MSLEAQHEIAEAIAVALDGQPVEPAILPLFSAMYSACVYAGKDPWIEFERFVKRIEGATHLTTTLN